MIPAPVARFRATTSVLCTSGRSAERGINGEATILNGAEELVKTHNDTCQVLEAVWAGTIC